MEFNYSDLEKDFLPSDIKKGKTKTLVHAYKFYLNELSEAENPNKLTKKEFIDVCSEFNIRVMDRILEGEVFYMGFNLSSLSIVRVETDFNKPKINWLESNKFREKLLSEGKIPYSKENPEGIKWFVYYLNDFYYRFYWSKFNVMVKNKTVYRFFPSRGKKGNKEKLIHMMKNDELAYTKFKRVRNIGELKKEYGSI